MDKRKFVVVPPKRVVRNVRQVSEEEEKEKAAVISRIASIYTKVDEDRVTRMQSMSTAALLRKEQRILAAIARDAAAKKSLRG